MGSCGTMHLINLRLFFWAAKTTHIVIDIFLWVSKHVFICDMQIKDLCLLAYLHPSTAVPIYLLLLTVCVLAVCVCVWGSSCIFFSAHYGTAQAFIKKSSPAPFIRAAVGRKQQYMYFLLLAFLLRSALRKKRKIAIILHLIAVCHADRKELCLLPFLFCWQQCAAMQKWTGAALSFILSNELRPAEVIVAESYLEVVLTVHELTKLHVCSSANNLTPTICFIMCDLSLCDVFLSTEKL